MTHTKTSTMKGVWADAEAYEPYIGRWSRPVARQLVEWVGVHGEWLDVGCGTGAVSEAIVEWSPGSRVVALDRSEGYIAYATRLLAGRPVRFVHGDALEIAFDDDRFDAVASGLVLNFLSDAPRAVAGMARVARRGGALAAYVWDYAGGMGFLRAFWDVAHEIDPTAVSLDEARRSPLCAPQPLAELFRSAGLHEVSTRAIEVETHFASFDDLWRPFLGGQGTVGSFVMRLPEAQRNEIRDRLWRKVGKGRIELRARAWAVKGLKP
ncbi:methyltransferase [Sorangium cellulosum]|uniref:Methyltransferase n=1 Tax=Sorangium cellulosum TaxID=56 RepID=A0A4P2QB39_SORCE|nr:class I SAM-dependent methyltransferase [Sorangium cellulosum]AUX26890.1 methyltransferase [Sorangium cellulosum]